VLIPKRFNRAQQGSAEHTPDVICVEVDDLRPRRRHIAHPREIAKFASIWILQNYEKKLLSRTVLNPRSPGVRRKGAHSEKNRPLARVGWSDPK